MAMESAQPQADRRASATPGDNEPIVTAHSWERGVDGEVVSGEALGDLAQQPGWTVLNDVPWPGRPLANIDHVIIGASGIFVVDTVRWPGKITMTADELRQDGRLRIDAVHGVATAAQAVTFVVPGIDPEVVQPVVCLVRDEWINGRIGDVTIATTQNLVPLVKTRRRLLEADAVDTVAGELRAAFESERERARRGVVPPRTAASHEEPQEVTDHRGARRRIPIVRTIAGVGLVAVVLVKPEVFTPVTDFVSSLVTPDETGTPSDSPSDSPSDTPVKDDKGTDGQEAPAE
ncbi:hypothetical protein GCM10009843_31910 [Nocardioides bigeumensis]|uniref:NERD domain-containing protein n=1 Tax=Nocardioides bigeumensis TaxID=433657 RepID=A0ABN2YQ19_9ACTN